MDRKNLIALIAGCLAALLLICILLVGILDNIWPWDGVTAYSRLITGRTQNSIGPKETTAPTEEISSNAPQPGGEQGGAAGEQQADPSKPTVGEIGQKPVPPTLPDEESDVKIEVGDVVIGPSGSTETTEGPSGSTETTGSSTPTEEKADAIIDASQIPGW